MPIAAATIPPSAIGVSITRLSPYLRCSPSVTRNTPPKKPTSSPRTTTEGSCASLTSMAEFRAWIMFICAIGLFPRQLFAHFRRLPPEVLGHFLEDVLEHQPGVEPRRLGERAVADRFLPGARHFFLELRDERLVALRRPFAEGDEVVLEPVDGVSERELLVIVLGAVARRIVARRMRGRTIGHV